MFSPENKKNLINELNKQIEDSTFYSLNRDVNVVKENNDFDSMQNIGKPAFARLAKITNNDIIENTAKYSSIMDRYDTTSFKGIGVYRPLVTSDFNPLQDNVYNYSNTKNTIKSNYDTIVHRIGFENKVGEIVEKPDLELYKVVNNETTNVIAQTFEAINENNIEKSEDIKYVDNHSLVFGYPKETPKNTLIEPIAYNTYKMEDILKTTTDNQIIDFNSIPKELALVKSTNSKNAWAKMVGAFGNLKKIFHK